MEWGSIGIGIDAIDNVMSYALAILCLLCVCVCVCFSETCFDSSRRQFNCPVLPFFFFL